jgi:hypothetical protein
MIHFLKKIDMNRKLIQCPRHYLQQGVQVGRYDAISIAVRIILKASPQGYEIFLSFLKTLQRCSDTGWFPTL